MFLYGSGDTGKSTLINLITRILGEENIKERDPKSLNERFGKTAAYNKRLIYSNDLSFMKIEENAILKNLTGGDSLSIEFKNKEPFDFKFRGFLLYGMNELPRFGGDKGEHVYNRIIIVKCQNVVPKEMLDPFLEKKLFAECEGIVYKSIMAAREAIANNYQFSVTQKNLDALTEYKRENSYPVEFWQTYLTPLEAGEAPRLMSQRFYNNFEIWCRMNGLKYIPTFPDVQKEISAVEKKPWNELTKRFTKGMFLLGHAMNDDWFKDFGTSDYE